MTTKACFGKRDMITVQAEEARGLRSIVASGWEAHCPDHSPPNWPIAAKIEWAGYACRHQSGLLEQEPPDLRYDAVGKRGVLLWHNVGP